jgi:hypothetical protein
MVDRQNRITPILSSENMVRWNFGERYATPYIDTADEASFKRTIHMSQVAQTDCLRAETQHYRRGRDTEYKTGGATYWMLAGTPPTPLAHVAHWLYILLSHPCPTRSRPFCADNWPTESWTSLEYGGRAKLLHYEAGRFNAPISVSSYCLPSITNCTGIAVHVSSEELSPLDGILSVSAVRWGDGSKGERLTEKASLQAQGSFSTTYEGAVFAALLKDGGCTSVADCFVEVKFDIHQFDLPAVPALASRPPPINYQWITLWRDALLKPAKLTLTATRNDTSGVVSVTVTSDAVAPTVMVHCGQTSDFGTFSMNNGMVVLPGIDHTLLYTPRAFAPAGKMTPCTTAADFYAVAINGLSEAEQ